MSGQSDLESIEVALVKGTSPKACITDGIEILGGISKFIKEGDNVFIKFNLQLPSGFPTNTNFDTLVAFVESCKEAGARNISVGSFPFKGIPIKTISNMLNLERFFNDLGVDLAFLDNSNLFTEKELKEEQIKKIQDESYSTITIGNKEFYIPKIIVNSDKLISVNQVNVNPLFKLNLSILNSFSIVSSKYQEIREEEEIDDKYVSLDQYKRDLISTILDVYSIKKPDLVINDLFYVMEGAGPYIYNDSSIKKTNIVAVGNDAVAVDLITLKLMKVEPYDNDLIQEANKRGLGVKDLQNITVLGEKVKDNVININLCKSKLEDIKIHNIKIYAGKMCSGCQHRAYHLLNFMKTHLTKDLKYNPKNAFLIGQNPSEPINNDNIILYGKCAIKSTKNSSFRKVIKNVDKSLIDETKKIILKKQKGQKRQKTNVKTKVKPNKNILEVAGCPPDFMDSVELLLNYYGKNNMPNLTFCKEIFDMWINSKINKNLKALGVI
ncbi:MAG: DUF362 domain-containing protein [Candidatus Thorarchaeota archaeon]